MILELINNVFRFQIMDDNGTYFYAKKINKKWYASFFSNMSGRIQIYKDNTFMVTFLNEESQKIFRKEKLRKVLNYSDSAK